MNVHLHDGLDVVSACRKAGISDKTYYYWRKKFGGLGRPQLSEMKALKKENERLKKIVADLQLDKLTLGRLASNQSTSTQAAPGNEED